MPGSSDRSRSSPLRADPARLDDFLAALTTWSTVRHAFEPRHRSWFTSATEDRHAGVAVCMSDAPDFPLWPAITTDFVYVRLHGRTRKYASSYSAASLRRWADDALRWADGGRDVHIYFDNDAEGAAVHDARRLRAALLPALAAPAERTPPQGAC